MAYSQRQKQVREYRGQIPSPRRPTVAWREDIKFWAAIARGAKTEDACDEAGVSGPVGFRWFRHAGGVNPRLPAAVSGRYLSSSEREEIALWRAQSPTANPPNSTTNAAATAATATPRPYATCSTDCSAACTAA